MDGPPNDRGPANEALRRRTIVLVGLMGAGKTSVGKRLAAELDMPFRDGDDEIEKAAGLTIPEIFELYGEVRFREGERRVMARLLKSPPHVLATGGGAFMDEATRAAIKESAVSVWLKADIEVLAKRVGRKDTRPLLTGQDPVAVLTRLAAAREPVYATADLTVESGDKPHAATVEAIIKGLESLEQGQAA
jgi:shikimate kinase